MAPLRSLQDEEVQELLGLTATDKDFFESPIAWEDEVLYFLLPDRFSDNLELNYRDLNNQLVTDGVTPLFRKKDKDNAWKDEKTKNRWIDAGSDFVGGNIKGITSKLGYLKRLGVTALWIAPIQKQVLGEPTYHGYCIQNFLEVDSHFGTREDFKQLVEAAHREGIYIMLDIQVNHTGDVFAYEDGAPGYDKGKPQKVKGYWNEKRSSTDFIPFGTIDEKKYPNAFPDAGVWPKELQPAESFSRQGQIVEWEESPEYLDGDFYNLKKVNLGDTLNDEDFKPTPALEAFCDIWKFWIAYADLDAYRLDAGKHLGKGPCRYFVNSIREFAKSLGKTNFLIVSEIAGPDAMDIVRSTGLDGALGVGNIQEGLWNAPQGLISPGYYFDAFSNEKDSNGWHRSEMITMIDDHDQIWRNGLKARFGAQPHAKTLLPAVIGLNLCTSGIPCIYYGTEQIFDGESEAPPLPADAFIRESMFGGAFGAFGSRGRHFFDESTLGYRVFQDISRIRAREPALRRGDQWLRPVSTDGMIFKIPELKVVPALRTIIGWSRILGKTEVLCALNTDPKHSIDAYVLVDCNIHANGEGMKRIYPVGGRTVRPKWKNGVMAVHLKLGPGAFVVYR
ncbi:alpha-amylase [Microthyrium microscopicum]|uniref:Alpha-amylase n=1 Tax=Microthyrium microscopicum TaxID=703497 RepID=A0A6A6UDL2_9PEZI|nr:alpha-amylase [Microthyrium microscopicum]